MVRVVAGRVCFLGILVMDEPEPTALTVLFGVDDDLDDRAKLPEVLQQMLCAGTVGKRAGGEGRAGGGGQASL